MSTTCVMKPIITVKDHMKSLGLSNRKKTDRCIYATLLESGVVLEPRYLRGSKRDPASGLFWKRKFEYIVEQKYGIIFKDVVSALFGSHSSCIYHCYPVRVFSVSIDNSLLMVTVMSSFDGRSIIVGCNSSS